MSREDSPRSRVPGLIRRLAIFLGLGYLSILLMLGTIQRVLMYPAMKAERLAAQAVEADVGRIEDVKTETTDGVTLHGWHVFPETPAPGPRRAVIFFHGNGGHRGVRLGEYEIFAARGWETLAFDYRGYAENRGTPSEEGLAKDAHAAWNYATKQAGLSPSAVVLYGESLGGGVAVRLAAELCRSETSPGGIAVRSTFTSMVDAAAYNYPWLPVRWVLLDRYPSTTHAPDVSCPVLVIHGDRDRIVPHEHGERLFQSFPEKSESGVEKRFATLSGAGHNDYLWVTGRQFQQAVAEFFAQIDPDPAGPPPTEAVPAG